MEVPFVGGSYEGHSKAANPQRAINLFPELDREGGRSAMRGTSGLRAVLNLSAAELGTEILTNGGFTGAATSWTLGDKWAYGTDNAACTNAALGTECVGATWTANNTNFTVAGNTAEFAFLAGTSGFIRQAYTDLAVALKASVPYQVYFQVVDPVGNPPTVFGAQTDIIFKLGGTDAAFPGNAITLGTARSANGTFTETITTAATIGTTTAYALALGIYQNTNIATTKFKVQNMSVKRVLAGQTDSISQLAAAMAGSISQYVTYRLVYTISGYTGGFITPVVGGTAGVARNHNGTYSEDIICGSGGNLVFNSSGTFVGTLDAVSLKRVSYPLAEMRGLYPIGTTLFLVLGRYVYKVNTSYTATIINATKPLATDSGPVTMAHIDNGDGGYQLMINDGTLELAYLWDTITEVFAVLIDTNPAYPAVEFLGGGSVTAQDGFFLSHRPATNEFYNSDLKDGLSWDPLDQANAQVKTDPILMMVSYYRQLWIWKGNSTEIFYNSGDAELVFQRAPGGNLELGIAAAASVGWGDNSLFWLASDLTVRRNQGFNAVIISTPQLSHQIAEMSTVADGIGFCYNEEGHYFYQLTFPTEDRTFDYDVATGIWHERASWQGSQGLTGRHRANCYAFWNNLHHVGDYENNKLYVFDPDVSDDDGHAIIRKRVIPNMSEENKLLTLWEVELAGQMGVGLSSSGQGSDPMVKLRISGDGGSSWGPFHTAAIGKIGKADTRARFFRLGSYRDMTFEFSISDPVPVSWSRCPVRVTAGAY